MSDDNGDRLIGLVCVVIAVISFTLVIIGW